MKNKEKLLEVLDKERYGVKHVAEWLNISKQSVYNKIDGKSKWYYEDMLELSKHLGREKVMYIFFE